MKYTNTNTTTLLNIINKEKAFQNSHYDNNTAKKLQAINLVEQFLLGIDTKHKFSDLESVKNTGKYIRNFDMFNLGTATELCFKAYANKGNYVVKSKAQSYDIIVNGKAYEVKASLSATSKNTPLKKCKRVCLINAKGVWLMEYNEAQQYVDKYGRFSPNLEVGEYLTDIAYMMGY